MWAQDIQILRCSDITYKPDSEIGRYKNNWLKQTQQYFNAFLALHKIDLALWKNRLRDC